MSPTTGGRPVKRSEARERLLATASKLFYAEGINKVGVDRIISASNVTLATFYRHFPRKQELVVAYLSNVHELGAQRMAELAERAQGRELVRAIGDDIIGMIGSPDFRGCAFINAAAEFQDPQDPVRRLVAAHRQWYYERLRRAFADAGHPRPANPARHFMLMRDGAVTAGYLDSPASVRRTFTRGVKGLLRSIDTTPATPTEDDEI
jgi:AcrR family transcriptional regulator